MIGVIDFKCSEQEYLTLVDDFLGQDWSKFIHYLDSHGMLNAFSDIERTVSMHNKVLGVHLSKSDFEIC